jgi:hypothetical protein
MPARPAPLEMLIKVPHYARNLGFFVGQNVGQKSREIADACREIQEN